MMVSVTVINKVIMKSHSRKAALLLSKRGVNDTWPELRRLFP